MRPPLFRTVLMVGLTLALGACADAPTAPSALQAPTAASHKPKHDRGDLSAPVTGTLPGGGSFVGTVQITALDLVDGVLMATGLLDGTATGVDGTVTEITDQAFEVSAGLFGDGDGPRCDILFLDLGPINLDLLGLVVDLSQVTLDIHAVPGAGNLLGNLLCGVAGLLDGLQLSALLDQITGLLEDLLGILSPATGTLADGGTFDGVVTVTGLAYENGQVVATGVLNGTATDAAGVSIPLVNEAFATAADISGDETAGCSILDLDLAPIHLDLLGLVVDLSAVELDLTAVPGGGLLGSLLCAVAGLLDPAGGIFALLDRINDILDALG
jgi:hypothetical protein